MYHYQVGGLGSDVFHCLKYDTRALAEFVFHTLSTNERKDTIELVLGILNTGASYLLVTEKQMDALLQSRKALRRPERRRDASIYASLSPTTFHSAEELHAKLKTYEQRQNSKKKKLDRAFGQDTSPANKMFDQEYPAHSSFEHQRVLWSAMQRPIDVEKFGLFELPSWIASTSLVALTLQIWRSESIDKQRNDPTILSLELATVRCIAFEQGDYAREISHTLRVKIKEHSAMTNGPSMTNNDADLEVVNKEELGKRLNDFFASIDSKFALLLVYDKEKTLNALKKLGVDVDSYQIGISTLLYGENREDRKPNVESYSNGWGRHRNQDYRTTRSPFDDSKPQPRGRSASPNRRPYPPRTRSPTFPSQQESKPSPPPEEQEETNEEGNDAEDGEDDEAPPPAKVHVIDVLAHFLAVSRFAPGSVKSLPELAGRLGISEDLNGNECRLLIEAWKTMASGKAIDEQHAERASAGAFAAARIEYTPSSGPAVAMGSDGESDPNDAQINSNGPQRALRVVPGGLRPPTEDYDSDESDF